MKLRTERSVSEGGVHYEVHSGGRVPYWEQANRGMTTDASLAKREAMRWDPAVMKHLQRIWDSIPKLGQEGAQVRTDTTRDPTWGRVRVRTHPGGGGEADTRLSCAGAVQGDVSRLCWMRP